MVLLVRCEGLLEVQLLNNIHFSGLSTHTFPHFPLLLLLQIFDNIAVIYLFLLAKHTLRQRWDTINNSILTTFASICLFQQHISIVLHELNCAQLKLAFNFPLMLEIQDMALCWVCVADGDLGEFHRSSSGYCSLPTTVSFYNNDDICNIVRVWQSMTHFILKHMKTGQINCSQQLPVSPQWLQSSLQCCKCLHCWTMKVW